MRVFECPFCFEYVRFRRKKKKRFETKGGLKRHIKVHHQLNLEQIRLKPYNRLSDFERMLVREVIINEESD